MAYSRELNENLQDALNKITEYLARRDHSERELRTKMSRRFTSGVIDEALAEAKDRNWLKSPVELAEMVAQQLFRRGKGPLYINGYLRKKGLPALSFDDDEVRGHCRELLEQKFPNLEGMSFKERQKPIRFLIQRGFPERVALHVVSEQDGR